MKKNYLPILLWISTLLTGCDDFLSEVPDNRAQLDSKEKIAELLVTAYPEANYAPFCEAMSDNVEENASANTNVNNTDAYFWRDGSATGQDTPEYYWNACYEAIAAANHALRAIETAPDPSLYAAQKGEALVARAYSHFMLVCLFAKLYDPRTAKGDPGIPYVTEPETVALQTYERKTVQFVYEQIEKDLQAGLPLINDQTYVTNADAAGVPKFHFTQAAAHAFAVRFYLFSQRYDQVIDHANQVFPNGDLVAQLRPWNTVYKTYTATELAAAYTNSSQKSNVLLCETASDWARSFNGLRYSTGSDKFQEIFYRSNPTGGTYAFSPFYTSTGVYFVNKFREHFVRVGTNASTGLPYTILPLFTAEEVLLSRAEAHAMQYQFREAIEDLNRWVSVRVTDYNPDVHNVTYQKLYAFYQISDNRQAIIQAALDFRRVEFLHEGLRWFDVLRHHLSVTHGSRTGQTSQLGPDDPRRILQIPREAISLGGLAPNPR